MRIITEDTEAAWKSAIKDGPTRPTVRATIQKAQLRRTYYNTANEPGGDYDVERERKGTFTDFIFGGDEKIVEIRNIKTCTWNRSLDQDVAECTLTILNTDVVPLGDASEDEGNGDFELPGLFSYSRGTETIDENRWGYTADHGWTYMIVPDRVVKTYEGYGSDDELAPGDDPNLYMTGFWVIDDVQYSAEGNIVISMRDLGRLLIDQIVYPPVVPWDDYPMTWAKIESIPRPGRDNAGGTWKVPAGSATSSNNLYIGEGITDVPNYVGPSGGVMGHQNSDPIRGDNSDWWLSTGQSRHEDFVWWEWNLNSPQNIAGINMTTTGGPFRVFVSFQREDGTWIGKRKIPYIAADATEGVDIHAKIPYVIAMIAEKGQPFDTTLWRKYKNVKKVRLTFTKLRRWVSNSNYNWRAGLRQVKLYVGDYDELSFVDGSVLTPVGNYRDYTDIVKWVGAWGGFFWPGREEENYIRYSNDEDEVHYPNDVNDAALPRGRVWGSFQNTGTAGIGGGVVPDISADQFDKQPLMDVISYIRDMLGFLFFVDECGGMTWRLPNLYEQGNFITRDHKHVRRLPERTTDYVTIDEEETLLGYETRLSSKNLRERIFVGDTSGKYGACIKGYLPPGVHAGLRRIAGWTDQNFKSNRECYVAADMIAAAQMFDWRRSKVTIPGNPAIQMDDQIRIFERVTNETFFHYVLSVASSLDNEAGTWTYELETHWLGERPADAWAVEKGQLLPATQAYINTLGEVD